MNRYFTRALTIIISVLFITGSLGVTALAKESIPATFNQNNAADIEGITVTASTTEMNNGTYIVADNVTINARVIIQGEVTLVLGEGTTLTVPKGIAVTEGNKLTMHAAAALYEYYRQTIAYRGN